MNKNKTTGLSNKPFAGRPFLLVLFLAIEIFIVLYFFNDYRKHDNLYKQHLLRSFEAGYGAATNSYDQAVQMIFDDVVNKPEVLRRIALALDDDKKRDDCRNELYRLMLPSYERQKAIGILQVHFHFKDGTGFLRMHAPEKYGDNLFRRTGVYMVNKEQKPVKGFEVGYFADGYRFMYPLFYNGRHIGSVEFGITAEGISKQLNKIYPAHYLFMINRTIVDNMTYADWKKRNYRESGLSDNFMIGQEAVEDTIVASINQKLRDKVRDRLAGMGPFVEKKTADGKDYLISFLPVRDVKGDAAAYFVQYINDEYWGHYFRITVIDITLFALLFAAIFYAIDNIQARQKSLEQKNVEVEHMAKTLHEREKKYRDMFESATDAIFILDIEGNFIDVNSIAYSRLGYSKEEMLSIHLSQLDPPEFAAKVPERMAQLRDHGFAIFETAHIRKDGTVMPVEVNARLYDYEGKMVYLSFIRDITERKKAEEKLKESESRFRGAFENVSCGASIVNLKGQFIRVNQSLCRMLGYSMEELLSKTFSDITYPDDMQIGLNAIKMQVSGGSEFMLFEKRYIQKNGTIIYVTVSPSVIRDNLGNPQYFVTLIHDITERKKAEAALLESEVIFRSFMEYSPIYVFFKDENIRSVRLSRNYETMLGRPIDELLGKSMDDLFPSDLAKSMIADDMLIMKEGKTVTVEEEFNGRVYYTIKFPIHIDGKPSYLAGYTIDITDRRKDEEKIKKALTEKETLLREIHHRVKNNMQVIISLLKLQAQRIQDKDMKKPFEESEQRIRAMALVHERLYQKDDLSGINFSEYIHNIIRELKVAYHIDERKVAVKINVEDIVFGVDSAIPCGLIINELITNCFKYAFPEDRSGEVIVNFTKEGNTYNLTIRDNGVGLAAGFDFRQTTTLGMQLVNVLTKQLLGNLQIRTDRGTEAVIAFKIKERVNGKE